MCISFWFMKYLEIIAKDCLQNVPIQLIYSNISVELKWHILLENVNWFNVQNSERRAFICGWMHVISSIWWKFFGYESQCGLCARLCVYI